MGFSPVQFFRKEDFPEVADQAWVQRLFQKLNDISRQNQNTLSNNITVSENINGYWWEGIIGSYFVAPGVIYPYTSNPAVPAVTIKNATAIPAFPFQFENKISPRKINGIFVGQSFEVTNTDIRAFPAMAAGVAWAQEASEGRDVVKVYGINGMVIGRAYFTRLLILGE
jgi:hypothetical protein